MQIVQSLYTSHHLPPAVQMLQTNNHTQITFKSQTKQTTEKQTIYINKQTQQINNQCKLGKVSIPNMNTGHPVSHCPWLHPSDSCSVHSSLYPSFSWASGNAIIHVKIVSNRKLRVFSLISTQAPSSYYYLELRFNRTVQFQQKQINFEKGVGVSNLSKHHVANFGIEFTHQKSIIIIIIIMIRCDC